jgi:hypothetical protein
MLIKLQFSRQIFEKNHQMSNFMKIHTVGAELFPADGQTDRETKLIVDFRNFANAHKNGTTVMLSRAKQLPTGQRLRDEI